MVYGFPRGEKESVRQRLQRPSSNNSNKHGSSKSRNSLSSSNSEFSGSMSRSGDEYSNPMFQTKKKKSVSSSPIAAQQEQSHYSKMREGRESGNEVYDTRINNNKKGVVVPAQKRSMRSRQGKNDEKQKNRDQSSAETESYDKDIGDSELEEYFLRNSGVTMSKMKQNGGFSSWETDQKNEVPYQSALGSNSTEVSNGDWPSEEEDNNDHNKSDDDGEDDDDDNDDEPFDVKRKNTKEKKPNLAPLSPTSALSQLSPKGDLDYSPARQDIRPSPQSLLPRMYHAHSINSKSHLHDSSDFINELELEYSNDSNSDSSNKQRSPPFDVACCPSSEKINQGNNLPQVRQQHQQQQQQQQKQQQQQPPPQQWQGSQHSQGKLDSISQSKSSEFPTSVNDDWMRAEEEWRIAEEAEERMLPTQYNGQLEEESAADVSSWSTYQVIPRDPSNRNNPVQPVLKSALRKSSWFAKVEKTPSVTDYSVDDDTLFEFDHQSRSTAGKQFVAFASEEENIVHNFTKPSKTISGSHTESHQDADDVRQTESYCSRQSTWSDDTNLQLFASHSNVSETSMSTNTNCTVASDGTSHYSEYTKSANSEIEDLVKDLLFIGDGKHTTPGKKFHRYTSENGNKKGTKKRIDKLSSANQDSDYENDTTEDREISDRGARSENRVANNEQRTTQMENNIFPLNQGLTIFGYSVCGECDTDAADTTDNNTDPDKIMMNSDMNSMQDHPPITMGSSSTDSRSNVSSLYSFPVSSKQSEIDNYEEPIKSLWDYFEGGIDIVKSIVDPEIRQDDTARGGSEKNTDMDDRETERVDDGDDDDVVIANDLTFSSLQSDIIESSPHSDLFDYASDLLFPTSQTREGILDTKVFPTETAARQNDDFDNNQLTVTPLNGLLELALCAARAKHQREGMVYDESNIDVVSEIKFSVITIPLPLGLLLQENSSGCWVTRVFRSGNAARAARGGGVEVGDQLTAVNGKSVIGLKVIAICGLISDSINPKEVELTFLRYVGEYRPAPGSSGLKKSTPAVFLNIFESDKESVIGGSSIRTPKYTTPTDLMKIANKAPSNAEKKEFHNNEASPPQIILSEDDVSLDYSAASADDIKENRKYDTPVVDDNASVPSSSKQETTDNVPKNKTAVIENTKQPAAKKFDTLVDYQSKHNNSIPEEAVVVHGSIPENSTLRSRSDPIRQQPQHVRNNSGVTSGSSETQRKKKKKRIGLKMLSRLIKKS